MKGRELYPERAEELDSVAPGACTEELDRYAVWDDQMLQLVTEASAGTAAEFKQLVHRKFGYEAALNARFWLASAQQRGVIVRSVERSFRTTEPGWAKSTRPNNGYPDFGAAFPDASRLRSVARQARRP